MHSGLAKRKANNIIQLSSDIHEICRPLFLNTAINYFAYVNVDKARVLSGGTSSAKWTEHYLEKKYYNYDIFMSLPAYATINGMDCFLFDSCDPTFETNNIAFRGAAEFYNEINVSISNMLLITNPQEKSKDYFFFCMPPSIKNSVEIYLSNLDTLKSYVNYFNDKFKGSSLCKTARDNAIKLSSPVESLFFSNRFDGSIFFKNSEDLFSSKKYFFDEKNYLTVREQQVIRGFSLGKSSKQIADSLSLSKRTVDAHLNNIRKKMNCRNTIEVLSKLISSGFDFGAK